MAREKILRRVLMTHASDLQYKEEDVIATRVAVRWRRSAHLALDGSNAGFAIYYGKSPYLCVRISEVSCTSQKSDRDAALKMQLLGREMAHASEVRSCDTSRGQLASRAFDDVASVMGMIERRLEASQQLTDTARGCDCQSIKQKVSRRADL